MKLYLRPAGSEIDPGTGIGRVVQAQLKYLPDYGIQIVDDPKDADVVACHTQDFGLGQVDVLHCHGLYWEGDPGSGSYSGFHHEANKRIIATIRRSRIITVPSDWVAMPFKRDMRISPVVIGHGIDLDDWQAGDNRGYILWNKNRPSDVCDPTPPFALARRGLPVRSTYMPEGKGKPATLEVLGRMPFAKMRTEIQNADIYLSSTKETFGIGILEAMACGVPVLAWDWGGNRDLITHGENGYLVKPYDYDATIEGYWYIKNNRDRMSKAASEFAQLFGWKTVIEKYVEVYQQVQTPDPVGVTVVIPCYNYGAFVGEAIDSVLAQKRKADQIVVIDDGSTDNSREIIQRYADDGKIEFVTQQNKGVAAARNLGIAMARNPFITCLDADDRLAPLFIGTCLSEMQKDRGMGIAYTGIGMIHGKGQAVGYTAWPPEFNWESQATVHVPPSNCISSACMFRRSMWKRAGGYRQDYAPGEDTEFWTRGLSVGFTARKVSDQPLFEYRVHQSSASRTKKYRQIDDWMPWMRDGNYPMAAPATGGTMVASYFNPRVSVIIPVGEKHINLVSTALECLIGQSMRDWEAIVVLDSDKLSAEFERVMAPYPFATVLTTGGSHGAGRARNLGIKKAHAPLVLFLDADDWIMPDALELLMKAWDESTDDYIYTDWQTEAGDKHLTPEFDAKLYQSTLYHGVTALMEKGAVEKVGGFDDSLPAWEDWDFYLKLATAGYNGRRLPGTLLVYNTKTGTRRSAANKELHERITSRYAEYLTGVKPMGCGSCGGGRAAKVIMEAKRAIGSIPAETEREQVKTGTVRIEYFGPRKGAVTYVGKSGRQYQFGNSTLNRYADVDGQDAALFLAMEFFKKIERPAEVVPPTAPIPAEVIKAELQQPVIAPTPASQPIQDAPVAEAKPAQKRRRR